MFVKDDAEKFMLAKNFHNMQLPERSDVGEVPIGEILIWWICMKLYVGYFTSIQKILH